MRNLIITVMTLISFISSSAFAGDRYRNRLDDLDDQQRQINQERYIIMKKERAHRELQEAKRAERYYKEQYGNNYRYNDNHSRNRDYRNNDTGAALTGLALGMILGAINGNNVRGSAQPTGRVMEMNPIDDGCSWEPEGKDGRWGYCNGVRVFQDGAGNILR